MVPKFHFDPGTGELGERNGVYATGLEHKLGITGSPTCEVTFGGEAPAVGWLLGDRHAGIQQMFEIIKHVRMLVGVKAMATLSTGYLNAREYALNRVQGQPLVRTDAAPGAVPIIDHPDVRRSLMTQKAYAEGMRALILYAASQQDRIEISRAQGTLDTEADACHQLLLPVIKGYCSETAWRILGQESLQTFGGSGYLKDYPSNSTSATPRSTPSTRAPPASKGWTCSAARSSATAAPPSNGSLSTWTRPPTTATTRSPPNAPCYAPGSTRSETCAPC